MDKETRKFLSSLVLHDKLSGQARICPKCYKRHGEYRESNKYGWPVTMERLYRSKYRAYCFSCIQTELLLPSEE